MIVQKTIEEKLNQNFEPKHLEVINESSNHNVPPGSESHFKVIISSSKFDGLMRVRRHQSVYDVLSDELKHNIHALALHTFTPEEWDKKMSAPDSPKCMGGSKGD